MIGSRPPPLRSVAVLIESSAGSGEVIALVRASAAKLADANDLERVRAAGLAHGLTDREHHEIAGAHLAARHQTIFGLLEHGLAIIALLEEQGTHVAIEGHLALRGDL